MRIAPLILLAGCYRGTSEPTAIVNNQAVPEQTALTMTPTGVGPIDNTTKATLTSLRGLLVGYEVRPVNDGSLEYDIYKDGERLAYVVPDEQSGYVFNIHAVSARVSVRGHPWRVGRVFGGSAQLTTCECWGDNPTCYARGDHLAVNFDRQCRDVTGSDRRVLRELDGLIVQRVIWSPYPFGVDGGSDDDQSAGGTGGNAP